MTDAGEAVEKPLKCLFKCLVLVSEVVVDQPRLAPDTGGYHAHGRCLIAVFEKQLQRLVGDLGVFPPPVLCLVFHTLTPA